MENPSAELSTHLVNSANGLNKKSKNKKIGGYNNVGDVVSQALRLHLCAEDRCQCSDNVCLPMSMQKGMEDDVGDVVMLTEKANRMCYLVELNILNQR